MIRPRAVAMLAALLLAGCAGSIPPSQQDATPPIGAPGSNQQHGLPALGDLPRTASAVTTLNGADYTEAFHVVPNGTNAIFTPDSKQPKDYAYAVYMFDGLSAPPPALIVSTTENYETKTWVALGNWQRMTWDFRPGSFFTNPSFTLDELGDDPARYLSPDGRFVVALLVLDLGQPVTVRTLQLGIPAEVTDLAGSDDRWDAVRLTWTASPTSNGYRIWRRPAGSPDPWVEVTTTPLSRYAEKYDDTTADQIVQYDYRLSSGERYTIHGSLQMVWSSGAITQGSRRASTLDSGGKSVLDYWPANLQNFLSFFYVPLPEATELNAARSTNYPPDGTWSVQHSGEDGFGEFNLDGEFDLPVPFVTNQESATNNPLISLSYSNGNGTFAQIGTISTAGVVSWETPVQMRTEDTTHVLGLVDVPRHLIAFMWNSASSQVEAMETIDDFGRAWTDYAPDSWMDVTSRKPDVLPDMLGLGGEVYINYREADTHQAVVIRSGPAGWEDISPGLIIRDAPLMRYTQSGLVPGQGLMYVNDDGSEIRLLRRANNAWGADDLVTAAMPDGEITELALQNQSDASTDHYLAYISGGHVFFRHGDEPSYSEWAAPVLVDGTGLCRDLKLIFVGTDPLFQTNYVFACYLKDDGTGAEQVNFRELKLLLGG